MERILNKNGINKTNISAAGGPCLAKSLAERVHTSVVFANNDIKIADDLSKLVSTKYYHVFTSNDVVGVEVCAAIKNIFSMVVGASNGLCTSHPSPKISESSYLNHPVVFSFFLSSNNKIGTSLCQLVPLADVIVLIRIFQNFLLT